MRDWAEALTARRLSESGLDDSEVARTLSLPRETIRDWRRSGWRAARAGGREDPTCPRCSNASLNPVLYSYLLGLYLGDGWLSSHRGGVYRLRVSLDARQQGILRECVAVIGAVSNDRRVSIQPGKGCRVVSCYWKHWPCLFPQHGRGRKHRRLVELMPWQLSLVRDSPGPLLRGLIHADGCRVENRIGGRAYPRYFFSNRSADILAIFCAACDDVGLTWTRPSSKHVSIARRADVVRLDAIVGPKF